MRALLRWLHAQWMALFGIARRHEQLDLMGLKEAEPGRVLDIGCGNGGRLARLQALGWRVEGQELDPVSAAIAQEALASPVFVGPLTAANFAENTFDAVISNHVIEHVHDAKALLTEAYRILKPGGILTVVTPNAGSLGHRVFQQHWMGLDPPRHLRIFSNQSLGTLAVQSGLENCTVQTSAARAEAFVIGSLVVRSNRKNKTSVRLAPGTIRRVAGSIFAPAAFFYRLVNRKAGEECILVARKAKA